MKATSRAGIILYARLGDWFFLVFLKPLFGVVGRLGMDDSSCELFRGRGGLLRGPSYLSLWVGGLSYLVTALGWRERYTKC